MELILMKMCEFADADFDKVDFKADEWYLKHTWTRGQETKFIKWLAKLIKKDNKVRFEITTLPYRPSMKSCMDVAFWFNMTWGWKTV